MYYCVLDFEATCIESGNFPNEIIEFPSILYKMIDEKFTLISKFESFVKPVINPILSEYCKKLTNITQENVDGADHLKTVFSKHYEWLRENCENKTDDVIFITCGKWDLNEQLPNECKRLCIKIPKVYKKFIDIKDVFRIETSSKPASMMNMLEKLGIKHTGIHHRGIDDCINIAKIVEVYFNKNLSGYIVHVNVN